MNMRITIAVFLLLVAVVAHSSAIDEFDSSLYRSIYDGWRCDFADAYFSGVTLLGSVEFCLSANTALLCFGDDKMRKSAKLTTVGLASTMLVAELLKCAVGRERPEETNLPRCKSSFPSGHTTAAFTMAYVYGAQYPKLRIPLYFLAVSVAISRIYLGKHYPTDVIAGAVIGTAGGIIVVKNKDFILKIGL